MRKSRSYDRHDGMDGEKRNDERREPWVDARDLFFFGGLIAVAVGLSFAVGWPYGLVAAGLVLLVESMRG